MTAPTSNHEPAAPATVDLKDYRQPMVTAIGIILGFLIGFLGNWVTEGNFKLTSADDRLTFWGCLAGSACLYVALIRMLRIAPATDTQRYYERTLLIFSAGVALAFLSILMSGFI